MDVPVRMLEKPLFDFGRFVRRIVVHDDVDFLIEWHLIGNAVQEFDKLLVPVLAMALPDDFACGNVQRSEE